SPLARRIARERGVELAGIAGSGPGGRIIKADVENAAPPALDSSPPTGPPRDAGAPANEVRGARGEVQVIEPTKLQAAVARRMSESKATAPHFYLESRIDMTRCVEGRAKLKASGTQVVPSLNDMVVKA